MKRIGLILAAIVGLLLIANGVMGWRTRSRLAALKATVRAAGDPASIAELKPAPILASANAAAQIAALTAEVDAFGKDEVAFDRSPLGEAYRKRTEEQGLPTAEESAAMQAILDKHAALGLGVSRAAACNAWASVGDFSLDHRAFIDQLLKRIQDFRGAARYAHWDAQVLASEGKRDEAVRRGIELLKLSRLSEAEPTLVANLVSIAVRRLAIDAIERTLASGPASPEARSELDAELAQDDRPGRFATMLRMERGAAFDAFDPSPPAQVNPILVRMFGWSVERHYIDAYESMGEVIKLAEGPWPDFRRQVMPWGQGNAKTGHGVLADLLAPAIAAAAEAHDRDVTMVRSLRVLNALQTYAAEHGREASGLADLGLPVEATTDPVSAVPLVAKRVDDAWIVYGVGKDGKDDGGEFKDLKDVGVGPRRATARADGPEADDSQEE